MHGAPQALPEHMHAAHATGRQIGTGAAPGSPARRDAETRAAERPSGASTRQTSSWKRSKPSGQAQRGLAAVAQHHRIDRAVRRRQPLPVADHGAGARRRRRGHSMACMAGLWSTAHRSTPARRQVISGVRPRTNTRARPQRVGASCTRVEGTGRCGVPVRLTAPSAAQSGRGHVRRCPRPGARRPADVLAGGARSGLRVSPFMRRVPSRQPGGQACIGLGHARAQARRGLAGVRLASAGWAGLVDDEVELAEIELRRSRSARISSGTSHPRAR